MTSSPGLTFVRGRTADDHPWVVAFEGGPTAIDPEQTCRVSGQIGRAYRLDRLTAEEGSELASLLPHLELGEVAVEFALLFARAEQRRHELAASCPHRLEQRETAGHPRARNPRCFLKPPTHWPRPIGNGPSPAWRWVASGGDIGVFGRCSACGRGEP